MVGFGRVGIIYGTELSEYLTLSLALTMTLTLLTLTVTVRVTLTLLTLILDTVVNKAPTSVR